MESPWRLWKSGLQALTVYFQHVLVIIKTRKDWDCPPSCSYMLHFFCSCHCTHMCFVVFFGFRSLWLCEPWHFQHLINAFMQPWCTRRYIVCAAMRVQTHAQAGRTMYFYQSTGEWRWRDEACRHWLGSKRTGKQVAGENPKAQETHNVFNKKQEKVLIILFNRKRNKLPQESLNPAMRAEKSNEDWVNEWIEGRCSGDDWGTKTGRGIVLSGSYFQVLVELIV